MLVTGGSGFIGTWVLRELLEAGRRLVALDVRPAAERWNRVLGVGAKEIKFSDVSLTDRDKLAALMKDHEVSHVIHLAALLTPDCQQDPFRGCQVNVLGSTAVFDAARITGGIAAISYASSYAVYGDQPQASAEHPHSPPMFYGAFPCLDPSPASSATGSPRPWLRELRKPWTTIESRNKVKRDSTIPFAHRTNRSPRPAFAGS